MQTIEAPYLEIGFYFKHVPEKEAFVLLLKALFELGFQLGNRGYVFAEIEDREDFASISDKVRHEVPLNSWIDVDNLLADPSTRLVQVVMNDVVNNSETIVTYISISPEAVRYDSHPIAIWSSGELFSGTLTNLYKKQVKRRGKQAYQLLKDLVNKVRPSYATITVEEPIECPKDLSYDSRSYAFSDCYVEETFLGSSDFMQVKKMFRNAYTELLGDGIYISCYEYFNPEGQELSNDLASGKSGEVAKLIAKRSRK